MAALQTCIERDIKPRDIMTMKVRARARARVRVVRVGAAVTPWQ